MEVLGSSPGWNTTVSTSVSLFSSVTPGKCLNNNPIRQRPLPSKSLAIQQSSYHRHPQSAMQYCQRQKIHTKKYISRNAVECLYHTHVAQNRERVVGFGEEGNDVVPHKMRKIP